jgi:hypothetical protein
VLLKKCVYPVAAALAFALGVSGVALAKGNPHLRRPAKAHVQGLMHIRSTPSLVPSFAPHLDAWLSALWALRHHEQKPAHAHGHDPKRQAVKRQPRPRHRLRGTTSSIYEHTTKPWVLAEQGCSAAQRNERGVVILDFGKPAHKHHAYGTLLFSGRFAPNHKITTAMVGYARGYVSCLPEGSDASITLARGTSNYHPSVPSAYTAGVRWARATNRFARILHRKGLDAHVESAAADDAEPAWDPRFRKTRLFFHGFRAAVHGHTLYNYGSLDGGVGAIWSARQAWYVSGGIRHTKALPEIYNTSMAQQWAELARIAHGVYHRDVHFAGVMTQGGPSCHCGLRPDRAHRVLSDALVSQGIGRAVVPRTATAIVTGS